MINRIAFGCLVFVYGTVFAADRFIRVNVDEPGNVVVIEEKSHDQGISLVEVDIIDPDAQGTAFAVVSALCGIALREEQTHFCIIRTDRKNGKYLKKVYFTSDPKENPVERFKGDMDEESQANFNSHGWVSVKRFAIFWTKMIENQSE